MFYFLLATGALPAPVPAKTGYRKTVHTVRFPVTGTGCRYHKPSVCCRI